MSTVISGYAELSTCPISSLPTTGASADVEALGAVDRPASPSGTFCGHAAEHFAIEVLDDFRTPLFPPCIGAS